MSRALQAMRAAWLVLYRNGLPRDMRKYVFRFVARNRFDWETTLLIAEMEKRKLEHKQAPCLLDIKAFVERPPKPLQDVPDEHGHRLQLTRVSIRRKYFCGLNKEWLWLYPD